MTFFTHFLNGFFLPLVSFTSIRRNLKGTQEGVRINHQEIASLKTQCNDILSVVQRLETKFDNVHARLIAHAIDIKPFLPASNMQCIVGFCSNNDGHLEDRRKELQSYLLPCATMDKSKRRNFKDTLADLLFTRECLTQVRWPNTGYRYFELKPKCLWIIKHNYVTESLESEIRAS